MKQTPDLTKQTPSVILPVEKDIIADYLRFLFNSSRNRPVQLSRKQPEGKYICSMIRYSTKPVKTRNKDCRNNIVLFLPKGTLSTAENHFTYFTEEDIERINDHLESSFDIFFRSFSVAGEVIGIQKKDVIEAFIVGTRMKFDDKIFERFKKNDYRFRLKMYNFLLKAAKDAGLQ